MFYVGMKYLKGSKMFGSKMTLVAEYPDVQGLIQSNPVTMNGLRVGKVGQMRLDLERGVVITQLEIDDNSLKIPDNFEAMIHSSNILGAMAIRLQENDSLPQTGFFTDGQQIRGTTEDDLFDIAESFVAQSGEELIVKVGILATELNKTVARINDLLRDPRGQSLILSTLEDAAISAENIKRMSYNMDSLTSNFVALTSNANRIIENVADNNDNIDGILANTKITTDSIAVAIQDFKFFTESARDAASSLESIITKIDTSSGSLGLLLNDPSLYDNLQKTLADVDKLVQDVQKSPGRYVDDVKLYLIERKPPKEKKKKNQDKAEEVVRQEDLGPPRN